MNESELLKSWEIDAIPSDFIELLHFPLHKSADAFGQTLNGISDIAIFLQQVIIETQRYENAYRALCLQKFKHPWHNNETDNEPPPNHTEVKEAFRNGLVLPGGHSIDVEAVISRVEITRAHHGKSQSLLTAVLLTGWTAIESFLTDLWLDAVDYCPNPLAMNVLQGKDGIKLSPDDLKEANFNFASSMGRTLYECGKVDLMKLGGIEAAYLKAFQIGNGKESDTIRDLFKNTKATLIVFESMRNLIAHRGGRIDQRFREQIRGYCPNLVTGLEDGEILPLTGELVRNHINDSVKFGIQLAKYISGRLQELKPGVAS